MKSSPVIKEKKFKEKPDSRGTKRSVDLRARPHLANLPTCESKESGEGPLKHKAHANVTEGGVQVPEQASKRTWQLPGETGMGEQLGGSDFIVKDTRN